MGVILVYPHELIRVAPGVSDGGLILPTRGLKYGFQGNINAKNLRKNSFSMC